MRRLLLLLTTTLVATAHASPTPMNGPTRMSGLWLMNTAAAKAAVQTSSFHICVGSPARDDVLAHPGSVLANCRDERWSKDEHYSYYQAVCDAKGGPAVVEGKFFGDFKYNFQGEFTATFSSPVDGMKVAKTEIDGRRLAPCKSDMPEGKFLIKGQDGVGNLNLGEPIRPQAR
jgi:hypothetical protein